jgi:hypothetical protein
MCYAASERPRVYRQNLKRYWTPAESRNRKLAFEPLLIAHLDFVVQLKFPPLMNEIKRRLHHTNALCN